MGCGTSNQVHVLESSTEQAAQDTKSSNATTLMKRKISPIEDDSISTKESRGGSAVSKASRHSGDSGFDDEEEQRNIQREILSRPMLSVKSNRVEEKQLLETLHEEGLIQKPVTRTTYGVSFEVMAEIHDVSKKPPPRLKKLELESKKKKKKVLTEDEIRQKLQRAEERKKERELQRLEKIHSLQKTDIQSAQESFTLTQKSIEETVKTKEELAAENRERKLREKLERLQKKKAHAEAVKQRRLLAATNQNIESLPAIGEDTAAT